MVGLAVLLSSFAVALLASLVSPYGPFEWAGGLFLPPSAEFPFGTDNMGRDVLSGVIWGFRISLLFGLGVAGISLMVGVVLGAIAGYFGGLVDDFLSRTFEIYMMIPAIFLIIMVTAIFGADIFRTMIVVGLTVWPSNAKITRAQVLTLKNRAFVQASIGSGMSHLQIIRTHILPNGIQPVIVNSTLQMASAIITEAGLSFLGLGDPNQRSWGQMLYYAQLSVKTAWWMAVFPGIAIVVLVVAFNLVGEGVSFVMNPRLQRRR
jgi:peptide/nickel transport system permease protein